MPTKKQYIMTLIAAVITFFIIFIIFFSYTYKKGLENPIVSPDETEIESIETLGIIEPLPEELIEMNTKITVKLIDKYSSIISESTIEPMSLLGFNEKKIKDKFKEYIVEKFSNKEVVLNKVIEIKHAEEKYKLGMKDNVIGIVVEGDGEQFISLKLAAKEFSKHTNMMMINKVIEISKLEKEKLEKNPYYIEQILQSYAE